MIRFDHVSITYAGQRDPVLRDVSLHIEEGELCLVVGGTGAGKSTLLGAVNGLVPHFTGGTLAGRVSVAGRDTASHPPRELADLVGVVGQDPLSGFVTDTVEEELAYGMEQLALAPATMRKRVEETLDLLGLAPLRHQALHEISGGQQQRVAIGSVLTAHPHVLVLDEPTSALDPTAAEEVLAAITRLVHDLGVTVLVAEHRLERVVQYADRVIHLPGDGTVSADSPAAAFEFSTVAPPVVELGRLAGWMPLPLSVRDARRLAGPLRARLSALPSGADGGTVGADGGTFGAGGGGGGDGGDVPPAANGGARSFAGQSVNGQERLLRARGVVVRYADVVAVAGVDLDLYAGQVVALMGRNGSGKSSLLWALQGSGRRQAGAVDVAGTDPKSLPARRARTLVGLVPQTPADLLYLERVDAELAAADAEAGDAVPPAPTWRRNRTGAPTSVPPGAGPMPSARELLDELVPGVPDDVHPRDLSEGQRLALVLAIQLRAAPPVVLLDEPTRGLDYQAKAALVGIVRALTRQGRAVVISTHDVEFVAAAAERVIVLGEGDVVADGPAREVLAASPAFAPQVAKILAPLPYLTIDEVRADLVAGVG